MIDLYHELRTLTDELRLEEVPFALCGALALAVHGAPRATRDLDFIARKEDEAAIRRAVKRAGYIFEALPMEFSSRIEVQRFSKLVEGKPLMVDFLWASDALAAVSVVAAELLTLFWLTVTLRSLPS